MRTASYSFVAVALLAAAGAPITPVWAQSAPSPRTGYALEARRATVPSPTSHALGRVSAELLRLWNPNCAAPGASEIVTRVRIKLDREGALEAAPELVGFASLDAVEDPVARAAAARALSAIDRAAPFEGLPVADYDAWKQFVVRFDGKAACRTAE